MNKLFAALALTAFMVLIASADVSALTVLNVSDEQLANKAELIVIGTVLSAYSEKDRLTGHIFTHISIRVNDHMKGTNRLRNIEVKTLGGVANGEFSLIPGAPDFHKNEEVLLFLERRSDGSLMPIGIALGMYSVYRDKESGQKIVSRQMDGNGRYFSTPREETIDAGPHNKIFLNEFRSRIQSIVSKGGQK